MNCGTRGVPDTVAPFRAWRGSRDLVAQSPKFHAPALAQIFRERKENTSTAFLTQPECAPSPNKPVRSKNFFRFDDPAQPKDGLRFWLRCRGGIRRLYI